MVSWDLFQLFTAGQQLVLGKVKKQSGFQESLRSALKKQKGFKLDWASCRETSWRKSPWQKKKNFLPLPSLSICSSIDVPLCENGASLYSQQRESQLQSCCAAAGFVFSSNGEPLWVTKSWQKCSWQVTVFPKVLSYKMCQPFISANTQCVKVLSLLWHDNYFCDNYWLCNVWYWQEKILRSRVCHIICM